MSTSAPKDAEINQKVLLYMEDLPEAIEELAKKIDPHYVCNGFVSGEPACLELAIRVAHENLSDESRHKPLACGVRLELPQSEFSHSSISEFSLLLGYPYRPDKLGSEYGPYTENVSVMPGADYPPFIESGAKIWLLPKLNDEHLKELNSLKHSFINGKSIQMWTTVLGATESFNKHDLERAELKSPELLQILATTPIAQLYDPTLLTNNSNPGELVILPSAMEFVSFYLQELINERSYSSKENSLHDSLAANAAATFRSLFPAREELYEVFQGKRTFNYEPLNGVEPEIWVQTIEDMQYALTPTSFRLEASFTIENLKFLASTESTFQQDAYSLLKCFLTDVSQTQMKAASPDNGTLTEINAYSLKMEKCFVLTRDCPEIPPGFSMTASNRVYPQFTQNRIYEPFPVFNELSEANTQCLDLNLLSGDTRDKYSVLQVNSVLAKDFVQFFANPSKRQ